MTAAKFRRIAAACERQRVKLLHRGCHDLAELELRKACRALEKAAAIDVAARDAASSERFASAGRAA